MPLILALLAAPMQAQAVTDDLMCSGTDWQLEITGDAAEFTYRRTSDLNLMLDTPAQTGDWPRALTFIGRGDSAIVILEAADACRYGDTGQISAQVLTQRGETPILLTGCCL